MGSGQRIMNVHAVKLPFVGVGDCLERIIVGVLRGRKVAVRSGDVVCVASKVVSIAERQLVDLRHVKISKRTEVVADRFKMDSRLAQVVIDEADSVLGGVKGFLLTLKHGLLTANAGVDVKNSPMHTATTWPIHPDHSAELLRRSLKRECGADVGLIIVDSRVTPLRLGTVGLAIGIAGLDPVEDLRGKVDLYNRTVRVTQLNVADDLAASAHLLMAERNERTGLVIIRNPPVSLGSYTSSKIKLTMEKCLIGSALRRK